MTSEPFGGTGRIGDAGPHVSVLIPTWNAEATIERAVASVLEARNVDLECVIVDDGSTDGTVARAREFAARDDRVRVAELGANLGVSAARNRGLEIVRGTWLTLLDADDRFVPGGLARLVGATVHPGVVAVIGQQVWSDGRQTWMARSYDIPDVRRAGRTSLADRPRLVYFVSPHAKLLHRTCYEGLQFNGRVLGDQPWVLRSLLRAGDGIEVLGEVVYEWARPRPGAHAVGSSITSVSRASADRGVEAALVAARALAEVRTEATLRVQEPARSALIAAYVERLLAYDFGPHLGAALTRGDRRIGELIDAIGAFVEAVPPAELAASAALARSVLEPPLGRWHRVDPAGRAAYGRLVATALRKDPAVIDRMGNPAARAALRAGAHVAGRGRPRLVGAILLALRIGSAPRRVAGVLWRHVRGR